MVLSFGVLRFALLTLAGLGAGAVNALAGGGTLVTFPSLTSLGVLPVLASATNTVALSPGYLGATFAQRGDLRAQGRRLAWLLPAAVLGGLAGGVLLLHTSERLFRGLVPFLILGASGLLAAQERLRAWLARRGRASAREAWAVPAVFAASVYGGYFGAGLSVIVLAVLALLLDDSLTRLNALKQALAGGVNVAAAAFFAVTGHVAWPAAAAVAVGAILGGLVGGRLAGRVKPAVLRGVVVVAGLVVGLAYLVA